MAVYEKKYNPDRSPDWNYGGSKWKLSRSKIDAFIECPRCFYLDNKLGTKRPSFPSFNLNLAVDELLKKEFDAYRSTQTAHPLMESNRIDAVPFMHDALATWRDNFEGITHTDTASNLLVSGAVDDIWKKPDGTLIVVDYKATSKLERIESLGDSPWEMQYERQLGVYRWLLERNGFSVDTTAYLVYANASKSMDRFDNTLTFETTLVPCTTNIDWIEPTLAAIKDCLESDMIPVPGQQCEYCPYREAAGKKFMAIHAKHKHT